MCFTSRVHAIDATCVCSLISAPRRASVLVRKMTSYARSTSLNSRRRRSRWYHWYMRPLASDTSSRGVRMSPFGRSRRARSSSSAYVDTKTSKAASDPIRLSQSKNWHRISPGRRTATRAAAPVLFCGAPASASQAVGSWHTAGVVFVGAAGCVPFVGAPVADDRSAHSAASSSICRDRMPRVQAGSLSHAREGCPHF